MNLLETAIGKVHQAGTAGLSFASLTIEEQQFLTGGLVPPVGQPFTPEIRALLDNYALIVGESALQTISEFTAPIPHKIAVRTLEDGTQVIGSDVLTWCGHADVFGPLQSLFHSLPIRHVPVES